ncbi:hypothetical protein FF80_00890 [Devosia sp. LC5]|nr:hypothetical protein FF80_00890 [Devosia sp. LC5]
MHDRCWANGAAAPCPQAKAVGRKPVTLKGANCGTADTPRKSTRNVSRTQHAQVIADLKQTAGNPGGYFEGMPVLLLYTIGAKATGQP